MPVFDPRARRPGGDGSTAGSVRWFASRLPRNPFVVNWERTMTKADLVEDISRVTGLNKKDTSIIVNEVINNICRALAEGDKVELRGFGSFKVKERRARQARNPRTGAGVQVPAKLVPFFKASNELKARVNDSTV
jgi:integration host factor subunit beta